MKRNKKNQIFDRFKFKESRNNILLILEKGEYCMLFAIKCVYIKILLSFASYEFFFLFFESRDDDFFIDLLTPDSKNF